MVGRKDFANKIDNDSTLSWSFAAVAAEGELAILLDKMGIQEPARGQIERQRPFCEEVIAWHLYTIQEPGLDQPLSYLIRRLLDSNTPPIQYLQMASLSWEQWRVYATVCHHRDLFNTEPVNPEELPLFSLWCELYDQETVTSLPFGVGEGLDDFAGIFGSIDVAGENTRDVAKGAILISEDAAYWQAALDELALQMTRATFNSWLSDAQFLERDGDTFVIGVRNQAAQEWLENRMHRVIEQTLSAVVGQGVQVVYVIRPV